MISVVDLSFVDILCKKSKNYHLFSHTKHQPLNTPGKSLLLFHMPLFGTTMMRFHWILQTRILFMDLVCNGSVGDNILQMALGSDLLKTFGESLGGGILNNIDQRHLLHLQTTSSCAIVHDASSMSLNMPGYGFHIHRKLFPIITIFWCMNNFFSHKFS